MPESMSKTWVMSKEAAYHYVNISCWRKRRPSLILARNKLKLWEGLKTENDAAISLGLEWFIDDMKMSLFRHDLRLVT